MSKHARDPIHPSLEPVSSVNPSRPRRSELNPKKADAQSTDELGVVSDDVMHFRPHSAAVPYPRAACRHAREAGRQAGGHCEASLSPGAVDVSLDI